MPTQLLTVKDIAVLLKISPKTAWKRVKAGQIPGFLMHDEWRIHPTVFDNWLAHKAGLPVANEKRRPGRPETDYKQKLPRDYPEIFGDKAIH